MRPLIRFDTWWRGTRTSVGRQLQRATHDSPSRPRNRHRPPPIALQSVPGHQRLSYRTGFSGSHLKPVSFTAILMPLALNQTTSAALTTVRPMEAGLANSLFTTACRVARDTLIGSSKILTRCSARHLNACAAVNAAMSHRVVTRACAPRPARTPWNCAQEPAGRTVRAFPPSWPFPPTHSGSCGAKRLLRPPSAGA